MAAELWGAVDVVHRVDGISLWPADRAERERYEAVARETAGDDVFEAAYVRGSGLTIDQAAALGASA